MTQRYAIEDPDQARRYLADSTLGPHLRQVWIWWSATKTSWPSKSLAIPMTWSFDRAWRCFREAACETAGASPWSGDVQAACVLRVPKCFFLKCCRALFHGVLNVRVMLALSVDVGGNAMRRQIGNDARVSWDQACLGHCRAAWS